MAFKERITVLFPEAEDIGRCSDQNETHISIKGCNNVTIQRRRIWTHPEPIDDDSVTRITWRNPLISIKQSSVIEPALNSGLNIYFNSSNRYKEPYVKTPVFNLIHKETFELEKYLSNVLNYSNFEWNPQDTNYDILIDNKSTTLIAVSYTHLDVYKRQVEILVVVPLEPLVALVALEETLETLAAWTAATVAKAATMVLNCIFSIVYRVAIV